MKRLVSKIFAVFVFFNSSLVHAQVCYDPDSTFATATDSTAPYYVQGTASIKKGATLVSKLEDTCDSAGRYVTEYFCAPTTISSTKFLCPYGCMQGACIKPGNVDGCFWKFLVKVQRPSTIGAPLISISSVSSFVDASWAMVPVIEAHKNQEQLEIQVLNAQNAILSKYWAPLSPEFYDLPVKITQTTPGFAKVILPFNPNATTIKFRASNAEVRFVLGSKQLMCGRPCVGPSSSGGITGLQDCCSGLTKAYVGYSGSQFYCKALPSPSPSPSPSPKY